MDTRAKGPAGGMDVRGVRIQVGPVALDGEWCVPTAAVGIVLFAHGSGSSRHSPRNRAVAQALQRAGMGTLLFDLLTEEEEALDARSGELRFDIRLLAQRLAAATRWVMRQADGGHLGIGYFGSSTGGAAALVAAAELGSLVDAVVSRGGRPDLAGDAMARVRAASLLIVGERDDVVLELNKEAFGELRCERQLAVVPGATHLFEEPGALEEDARLAAAWFQRYLRRR